MSSCYYPDPRTPGVDEVPEDWTGATKAEEGAPLQDDEQEIEQEPRVTKLIIEGVDPQDIEGRGPQELQEFREWLVSRGYPVFDVRVAGE